MHSISLLLPEGGEATEIANTISLLAPILAGHGATIGEVRRYPVRGQHAAIVGDMMRDRLPVLVCVEGLAAHSAVRSGFEVLDATVPEPPCDGRPQWLVITSDQSDGAEALLGDVRSAFDAHVVTPGYGSLPARAVSELGRRGLVLSAAESCTGGMLGEQITSIAGSSSVFWGSLVSYSNEAKSVVLGVETDTLEEYGAVSEEVVREMAAGVRAVSGADVAVAVSGIAGPGGGTEEKPVGTVWIACETSWSGVSTRLLQLGGGRDRVRRDAVWDCLCLVLSSLRFDD